MKDFVIENITWNNSAINKLLIQNNLPHSDINSSISFLCIKRSNDNKIIGIVGLEKYKPYALLRSLSVEKEYQRKGLGKILLNKIIDTCKRENIDIIYLLTTTAENYFINQGFMTIKRERAPDEIKGTTEFTDVCPKSSVCMKKEL